MTTVFYCSECGYESPKWMGQCPGCKAWNTFLEETVDKKSRGSSSINEVKGAPKAITEVDAKEKDRMTTGSGELDRVLGGGIVEGSLILVGGDPGIGKSTLLLQVCKNISDRGNEVLYVSGEESDRQIKIRADRIGSFTDKMILLCETDLDAIKSCITERKPKVVIIDSIQTMYNESVTSAPGSVSQVRETTGVLLRLAKSLNICIFIVGHVTKEGTMAGPRVLEHMVDTVLYFEGDRYASYRVLRSVKNRFGATNEIGVFMMQNNGLCEVQNPSEYMLNGRPVNAGGSVVTCSMEGTRPLLVEIQSLVCHSNFGIPRRQATGTDFNRLNLLLAVLEKRTELNIGSCDVYVNIAGGIKIAEPAIDLAIVMATVSSFRNKPVDPMTIAFGEVGLSGEVRAVSMAKNRVMEAKKLGFTRCIIPGVCLKDVGKTDMITVIGVNNVSDVLDYI